METWGRLRMATPTPEAAAAMSTEGDTGDDAEREQRKADQELLVKREKERRERKRLDRSRRMLREGLKADLRFDEDDALFRVERRGWPKNYPAARRLLRDKLPKSCRLDKAKAKHGGEKMAVPDRAKPTRIGGFQVYPHFGGKIVHIPEPVSVFAAFVLEEVQTVFGAISRVGTL